MTILIVMMASLGDISHWLLLLGVLIVSCVLVYVAWWALFADRGRGRRRCPRCWYDLAYSPGMTCGECGFIARQESQFQKTHRRYGVAVMAILASVVIAAVVNDRISQRGFASMLPTRVLLWMLPISGGGTGSIFTEIITRGGAGDLSPDQWLRLFQRCASGDWRAAPVTDEWINKYGVCINSWRQQVVNDPILEPVLSNIPPRIDIKTRALWPEDVPIAVSVQVRDWWPVGMQCRIRATPRLEGEGGSPPTVLAPITFYRTSDHRFQRSPYTLDLPPLNASVKRITFDFQIDRRRVPNRRVSRGGVIEPAANEQTVEEAWESVFSQSITVPCRAQGAIAQAFQPVNDAVMTAAMQQVLNQGVMKWSDGSSPIRFRVNIPATALAAMDDTAVGVHAELLCDGAVARRLQLWWIAGVDNSPNGTPIDRGYGFEVDHEDPHLLPQANSDDGRWQIRVRSDPALALRAGPASKYWNGEFTIPLQLRTMQDTAPPRAWWTDTDKIQD